jgi:O-antigen/teichoic acid export membrane protein
VKQLKLNVIANLAGRGWTALLSLGFVPLYISLMGIEAYALVGIYATLYSLLSLLDIGLSSTLNRELARISVQPERAVEARNLVRTLEIIYWGISIAIGIILVALTPLFAGSWVQAERLSQATVQSAFWLMGIIIAAQFPFILYTGGLSGLQRQVVLNVLLIGAATLRAFGAVLILWLVSPTIEAFFLWQLFVSLLQTVLSGWFLWRNLPTNSEAGRPRFRFVLLREVGRFAAGLTAIAFLGLLLNNLDKLILSNLLTLEMFGYYTVAATVATALYMLVVPIYNAVFPQFSQLVASGDETALVNAYHKGCQIMAVVVLPVAIFIAVFSYELLALWTGNPIIAVNAYLPLSLLVVGMAFNGLMNTPYALTLAYGWMKYPLFQNLIAIVIIIPLMLFATAIYGMPGAAASWLILNVGYILFGIQIMHTRLLPQEKWRWYVQDVSLPFAFALFVPLVSRFLLPSNLAGFALILFLGVILGLTLLVTVWFTPGTGNWLRFKLGQLRQRIKVII